MSTDISNETTTTTATENQPYARAQAVRIVRLRRSAAVPRDGPLALLGLFGPVAGAAVDVMAGGCDARGDR